MRDVPAHRAGSARAHRREVGDARETSYPDALLELREEGSGSGRGGEAEVSGVACGVKTEYGSIVRGVLNRGTVLPGWAASTSGARRRGGMSRDPTRGEAQSAA